MRKQLNNRHLQNSNGNHHSEPNLQMEKVVKGGGVALVANAAGQVLRLLLQILLSRGLGVSNYGLFSLGRSVLEVLTKVSLVGFQNSAVRYIPLLQSDKRYGEIRRLVTLGALLVALVSLAIGAAVFFNANTIANKLFESDEFGAVLAVYSMALVPYALLIYYAFCARGFKNIKLYSLTLELFHPGLTLVLVGSVLWFSFGLRGAVWSFFAATLLVACFTTYKLYQLFPNGHGSRYLGDISIEYSEIFKYSLSVFLLGFAQILLMHIDRLMLGWLKNSEDVGIYVVAALLAQKVAFVQGALNGIFAPMIAGQYHGGGNPDSVKNLYRNVTKWTQFLTVPILFLMIFGADYILALFGSDFSNAKSALITLCAAQYINIMVGPVGYMLVMTGKQNIELLNSSFMVIINIALNLLLIPRYGSFGAAIATGFSIAAINLVRLLQVYKFHGCHPFSKGSIITVSGISIAAFVWVMLNSQFNVGLITSSLFVVFSLSVYGLVFHSLAVDDEDQDTIVKILREKISIFRSK